MLSKIFHTHKKSEESQSFCDRILMGYFMDGFHHDSIIMGMIQIRGQLFSVIIVHMMMLAYDFGLISISRKRWIMNFIVGRVMCVECGMNVLERYSKDYNLLLMIMLIVLERFMIKCYSTSLKMFPRVKNNLRIDWILMSGFISLLLAID